jgi:phosphoglycolate phosphatase-like HAD superfamily hydrolase
MNRLILWDIDGTLVHAGQIAGDVFDQAIEGVTGLRPSVPVRMSGKTDPQIALEYLEAFELEDRLELIGPIMELLAEKLAEQEDLMRAQGHVLPGVHAALEAIARIEGTEQTLLTGNIQPNARTKLAVFGIDRHFDYAIGAFGSDHIDRCELVPIALHRSKQLRQRDYQQNEVWVIGDSPNDYACARAGGVRCLLVATGRSTVEELAELRPDAILEDLTDTDSLLALIG